MEIEKILELESARLKLRGELVAHTERRLADLDTRLSARPTQDHSSRRAVGAIAASVLFLTGGGLLIARWVDGNRPEGTATPTVQVSSPPSSSVVLDGSPSATTAPSDTATDQSPSTEGTPAPTTTTTNPLEVRTPNSWAGARTSSDGRELVIYINGGAPYVQGDPCTVDYVATVEEGPEDVHVRVSVVDHDEPAAPTGTVVDCVDGAYTRPVRVGLGSPLGDRGLLWDGIGLERDVFDGTTLLEPGPGVREEWRLVAEQPGFLMSVEMRQSWNRTWGLMSDTQPGECDVPRMQVHISQGPADQLPEPRDNELVEGNYDIDGIVATHVIDEARGVSRLTWINGNMGVAVEARPACNGNLMMPIDTLLEFARSLELPETEAQPDPSPVTPATDATSTSIEADDSSARHFDHDVLASALPTVAQLDWLPADTRAEQDRDLTSRLEEYDCTGTRTVPTREASATNRIYVSGGDSLAKITFYDLESIEDARQFMATMTASAQCPTPPPVGLEHSIVTIAEPNECDELLAVQMRQPVSETIDAWCRVGNLVAWIRLYPSGTLAAATDPTAPDPIPPTVEQASSALFAVGLQLRTTWNDAQ